MRPPSEIQSAPATFAEESRARWYAGAVTSAWLALALVPAFAVVDWVLFPPELFRPFLALRGVACVALGVLLFALYRPVGRRHPIAVAVGLVLLLGLMLDVMTLCTGREASPYYAGINLVLVAMALLLPWPPRWTATVAAALVVEYVALLVATGPIVAWRPFANSLAFQITTALLAVVGAAAGERLRAREFATRAALGDALRYKDEFLARMSHELRTPVHVMIGYTDILLEDALAGAEAEVRDLVERIRARGVGLHRLISELLDYAKVAAGKMDVQAAPLAVESLLADVAESFRPIAARKGLALETSWPASLPAVVTDGAKVEQILTNLVGNAVKFTDEGRVRIAATAVEPDDPQLGGLVRLDGAATPLAIRRPGILVLVEDSGIGVRPEDVARLANDFEQLDGMAARFGGTGLGLSVAKQLAALLDGSVAVRPRAGGGATFALWLPTGDGFREAA